MKCPRKRNLVEFEGTRSLDELDSHNNATLCAYIIDKGWDAYGVRAIILKLHIRPN